MMGSEHRHGLEGTSAQPSEQHVLAAANDRGDGDRPPSAATMFRAARRRTRYDFRISCGRRFKPWGGADCEFSHSFVNGETGLAFLRRWICVSMRRGDDSLDGLS